MLKYEVYLCAVISMFSQKLSKSVSLGRFAVNSVSDSTVWIVLGVFILATFASVDPPSSEARKIVISGNDWVEIYLAIQLTASSTYVQTSTMYAFSWLWWPFRCCQYERVIW